MAKCRCTSCGHEIKEECAIQNCTCCMPDHLGSFGRDNQASKF